MEITTQPVYVSASDIKFCGNITIKLSISVHNLYPGECYGAQLINRTWYIYVICAPIYWSRVKSPCNMAEFIRF